MSQNNKKEGYTEEQLIPLSALQHLLFCERQCVLIHLEQVWAENHLTAEGRVLHERAHEGADEKRPSLRITRGMPVRSLKLGVSGQCDVVEFHYHQDQSDSLKAILPVEYKRGKPKPHQADEVQVCAQAICIEEMLELPEGFIQRAALYYGQHRRRHDLFLDESLRQLTSDLAARLHALIRVGITPMAAYSSEKCDACSLFDFCQPRALRFKKGVSTWFNAAINSSDF